MRTRTAVGYVCLVGLPLLIVVGALEVGRDLNGPARDGIQPNFASGSAGHPAGGFGLSLLFIQILVLLVGSRAVGAVFHRLRQPRVVGEMLAGILLGPSLLGRVAPSLSAQLFPSSSLGHLSALSQIGLVLFMCLVGLSLDTRELRDQRHVAVLASHVSIAVPLSLGVLAALRLYPRYGDPSVSFTSFALFVGVAMSVTAFPVLARILRERGLISKRIGAVSMACAAIDDISGWCILAYVVATARVGQGGHAAWFTVGGAAIYVATMLFGVKPVGAALERSSRRSGQFSESTFAAVILLLFASAAATEFLGIHQLFGAFLLGTVLPRTPEFVGYIRDRLETITVVVLLPLFFAYSGMRTTFGVIEGPMWIDAILIVALAAAGKIGGAAIAARIGGMSLRDAFALGILMNTRGLMELVVLNIGLDIGIISPPVFAIMVLMALITTTMTAPLLNRFYPSPVLSREVGRDRWSSGELAEALSPVRIFKTLPSVKTEHANWRQDFARRLRWSPPLQRSPRHGNGPTPLI